MAGDRGFSAIKHYFNIWPNSKDLSETVVLTKGDLKD